MKIKDIYMNKQKCVVSLCIAVLCIVITLVSFVFPDKYNALAYAYPMRYPWQIFTGLFLHGAPNLSQVGSVGHLLFNMFLVLPFGVMIEKILGSKRFLSGTICFWCTNILTFYVLAYMVTPKGETAYGAGISGVAFSYGIIGLYILFKLFKITKTKLLKQVSFYLLLNIIVIMLIMINPYVAGVQSMIIHMVAVVSGIIFTAVIHKSIDSYLENK